MDSSRVSIFLGFPLASAHPFLLDSEPGQGQNAPVGTIQIITNYSEAVEIGFFRTESV